MSIPKMTPTQKYEQFCKTHPQYKKMSFEQVCSIMVEQKLLTKFELDELKKPLFDGFKVNNNFFGSSVYEGMGVHLGNSEEQVKPRNYIEKPKFYHPVIKSLEVYESGKVDLNSYTMRGLKQLYPQSGYDIIKADNGNISVTGKDGKPVLSVSAFFNDTRITFYNKNGKQSADIDKTGTITYYYTVENRNGIEVTKRYKSDEQFPNLKSEKYPNGDRKHINYDGKTGKIEFQDYWKKDGVSADWIINYSDGKPYKKAKGYGGKNPEYVLVKDLKNDIYAKNLLGLPTTRESLSSNVLKRINLDNVLETMEKYKETTGNDLIQDIDDEIGLSKNERNRLINHIETLYCKASPENESGEYLAQKLFDDIDGLGSGKLAQHVKMIDSKNLKYVLTKYRALTAYNNWEAKEDMMDIRNNLRIIPGVKMEHDAGNDIVEKLVPIEGLLTAISNEWGLSQKDRDNMIKQIIDVTLNEKAPEVQTRIKRNISAHPEDYHKVEIDLYRAENTKGGDMRNLELNKKKLETAQNKTFIGQTKQGSTGDCWLLAGLNSVIAKPKMLNELEKLVTIDKKTGDYHVKLNADGKNLTYKVSKRDLSEYTALSTGSEKVNAVEIAMDKYIRDLAYKDRKDEFRIDDEFGYVSFVTIDSNFSSFLWRTMFGNNYDLFNIKVDSSTEDFNNPNRVYEMSLNGVERRAVNGLAKSEKDENYSIISRHAYSIIGSDEKNIYLLNPWDSADKITITREDFKKLDANIEFYEIPKKK